MAIKVQNPVIQGLEKIIATPLLATLVVGASILILLHFFEIWGQQTHGVYYLKYLVPFIPPFIITTSAKRINKKKGEHDFIKDAEPLIFVTYLREISESNLRAARPDMISNSAERHLGIPLEELFYLNALPTQCFAEPEGKGELIQKLLMAYDPILKRGRISHVKISLLAMGNTGNPKPYLMNSVIVKQGSRYKWQATLMEV